MLVDANLLLYANHKSFPRHAAARSWLDRRLTGTRPLGLPWLSLLAFLRISSNARLFERPLPLGDGARQVQRWLSAPAAWVPTPTEQAADTLAGLLAKEGTAPKAVSDAHLAALAITHGLLLCTTDEGFRRFEGLRWENPLAP